MPHRRGACGVVTYPDGGRYAVAVPLRHRASGAHGLPDHDHLIGAVARQAVEAVREAAAGPAR